MQVLSPQPGELVANASRKAAARAKLPALIRVTGGPVARLSVKLNGHRMRGVVARSGKQRVLLSKKNGLTVGYNSLFVSATLAGTDHPLQVARRFVVGYPAKRLLTSSGVRRGAGSAPAALMRVRAPLREVHRITPGSTGGDSRCLVPASGSADAACWA